MPLELWPFQKDVVREAQRTLPKHRSVCIVLPTGAGKTAVSGEITLRIYRDVMRLMPSSKPRAVALYLVHRKELLSQTEATLDRIGLADQHGTLSANSESKLWRPLQVASIPFLARPGRIESIKRYFDPQIVFVDEGHHVAAGTWAKIVDAFPNAYKVLLTATPARLDGKPLGPYINHLILGPQIKELTPEYLAPVRTFSILPDFDMKIPREEQAAMMTDSVIADSISNWKRIARDRKTIFFATDIQHSQRIVERLRAEGVAAAHIDYKMIDRDRKRLMRQMREGQIQCVSNVTLFTEGTDWPDCSCVVLARNTNSFTLYRQMNGRAMRRKSDGRDAVILDLAGNVHQHGLADSDVRWTIEEGVPAEEKRRLRNKNRECESCGFVYPIKEKKCPRCGLSPKSGREILEVDYQLAEMTAPKKKPRKKGREAVAGVYRVGPDFRKIDEIRKQMGYKPGWTNKMMFVAIQNEKKKPPEHRRPANWN